MKRQHTRGTTLRRSTRPRNTKKQPPQEITPRKQVERELQEGGEQFKALEQRLAERTAEVERTNAELRREIAERQRIEEERREAEHKANDLIRYAPTAIYEIDFRGPCFTRVNDAMCRMSGYNREELLAMNPFDLMDEAGKRLLADRTNAVLAGESIEESVEYRIKAKDGRAIYAVLQTRLLFEGGKAVGAFVIAHDVTARRQAEGALREAVSAMQESEERLRHLGDHLPESAVYQYTRDTDGSVRFLYVSAGIEQIAGVKVADVLCDAGTLNRLIPPEHFQVLTEAVDRSARELSDFDLEVRMRRPDGEWRWMHLHSRPRRLPDGSTIWDGVQTDITRRKQAEQQLRESEERYRRVIETANEGIAIHELDGTITYVNQRLADLLGYSREEMIGKSNLDFVDDEERAAVIGARESVKERGSFSEEQKLRRKDGSILWTLSNVSPRRDGTGHFLGYLAMHMDITARKHAEEALRRSEEQYRDLVESSNSIIMRADENFNITYINPFGLRYFGYTAEELIGKNVLGTTIPWQDGEGRDLSAMVKGITADPEKYKTNVHQNMRKNGELVWVSWTNKVTYDRDGRFVDILAIGNDIDQVTKVEEARRESERVLRAVLEGSPDPVYVKDGASRILLANQALSQVVGKPLEGIVGRTDGEYYDDPAVGQRLREDDLQVMASQTNAVFEETVPTPSGERTFLSTKSPYWNASGEIIGIIGISHDITERKKAEEALEAAHRRTNEILESIQDGFFALDREWRFTYINTRAAANVGSTPQDLIGQSLWEKFPGIVGTVHETHYRQAMEEHKPAHFETDGVLTDASYDLRVYPSVEGISVYWLDITERKQIEQKLQRLNRELELQKLELQVANTELESFSYSVSHDLRAPLGAIDGFASMILKDYGAQLPPESKSLLQLVQENAQQMSRLIEALLLLSRTSRQPLTRQSVAPGELVAEVLRMLRPQSEGRQIEYVVDELAPCQGDPVLLRQVYVNLLSNALKFTRSRPAARIQVGCRRDKGEVVYFVKDNGVGFDMEQVGKLFGVFQRLHGEDEYEGTGIGLAIVQRIIRRHGGRVWAEAEVDKGACFYFTLG